MRDEIRTWIDDLAHVNQGLQEEVSQRQRAEYQLQHAHDELELKISERTKELAEAKERAELASKTKSDFLAKMSHELRTPLNGILGYADLMLHHSVQDNQRKQLSIIAQSGEHLLSLINDILDVAKTESALIELLLQPLELLISQYVVQVSSSPSSTARAQTRVYTRLQATHNRFS